MPKNIRLRIDNPCPQQWGRMTPENEGRFCTSCSKIVVDFTAMDDRDILSWLANRNEQRTCGRFRPDQLNRGLDVPREKRLSRWQYWAYLLAGLLFTSNISAQTTPVKAATEQQVSPGSHTPILTGDTTIVADTPSRFIRGRVIDEQGRPVSFAVVTIGAGKGTSADAFGNFSLPVAKLNSRQRITVVAVGYEPIRVKVKKLLAADSTKLITLKMREVFLGDVIVVED